MNKYYSEPSSYTAPQLHVTESLAMDDRLVINEQSGLFTTWGNLQYTGMCVSVVSDEISANNGLYMLMDGTKYDKQSWDSSAANYDVAGWRRIDNVSSNTASIELDTEQFSGDGTSTYPYSICAIDGGELRNSSNQQNQ